MSKNLGPIVSGYNVPEGRAWETVVFQAGKPVLDRELNLSQELDGGAAQAALRRTMPSGWLSDDFLNTSSATSGIFTAISVANTIEIPRSRAHVNGWLIDVEHTNNALAANRVALLAGPSAGIRTDLVILEVWRRLIPAAPDATGKSATGRIWRNGNVKIAPASDATLNFDDDTLDTAVAAETTKRVQIQYRLRAIANVNVFAYPYGIDDPSVFANSVPASAAAPDGVATLFTYANQSASGDPGLWIAGDGIPTNSLGTVDGLIYAIPLLAVFRRNTTAFAHLTNQNGGVSSVPGPSDRPDGLFSDIIASVDLLDLRHGVSPTGWPMAELLEKSTNAILDNSLRTEIFDNIYGGGPGGSGSQGTTVFLANEIGGTASPAAPGSATQKFDSVRRRFSDRSIYETVTIRLYPPNPPNWAAGDEVIVDPADLPIYPYTTVNWSSEAPAGVFFLDVLEAHWAGDLASHKSADAEPFIASITGVGAKPITSMTIKLGNIASLSLTDETLFVTLLVAYPRGVGLTHTPVETYGTNSFVLNTPPLPVGHPTWFGSFGTGDLQSFDAPHREVQLEYETVQLTYDQGVGPSPTTTIILPERAKSITAPPSATLSDSGRVVTLAAPPTAGTVVTISYTAVRPMPHYTTPQMGVYFRAAGPQMARNALLSGSLTVIPRLVGGKLLSITTGSGSQGEAYPFATAYVQTGGVFPSLIGTYDGESELAGTSEISVSDFDASTGMLNLPTYISMVANPESLTFTRDLTDIDVEGRTFFRSVPPGYIPNAYAQDLSNPDRHKNVLPILAELEQDSPLGHRGQLVVILLIRYALFDEVNGVYFDSDLTSNTTTASVFRVKGLLLNKRAS